MDWTKSSEAHFQHIRSLPYAHNDSGCSYSIKPEGDALYIAFQETNGIMEWFTTNFKFWAKVYDGVCGHWGIFTQWQSIRNEVLDLVYSARFKNVYVSGFSLGGGLTDFCVQDIGYHIDRDSLPVSVFGINYEGPRVFCWPNSKVKKACKSRLITVRNHWDPVHHLPPWLFGYKHYGNTAWIGKP